MRFARRTSLAIALALAGLCGSSAAQVNPPAKLTEGYDVIATKSIFLKNRAVPVIIAESDDPPPPIPAEHKFVLRGVVFQQDAFRAHVEALDGSGTKQLAVGDKVADGEVVEISMNGIRYLKRGSDNATWVGAGKNLSGLVSNFRESRR